MGPAGRPVRSPPGADSSLEESPDRRRRQSLRQRPGPESQERGRPDCPSVPGDRPTEGGEGFLGGEARSMSPARRRKMVDRGASVPVDSAAVRPGRREPLQPLLPSPWGLRRGAVPDAGDGPAVPGDPLLRFEANEGLAGAAGYSGEPEAGAAADAGHGVAGHLPATENQPTGAGSAGLSYLLGKAEITRPNQVWAADITYLPMARGFLYLVAVMD